MSTRPLCSLCIYSLYFLYGSLYFSICYSSFQVLILSVLFPSSALCLCILIFSSFLLPIPSSHSFYTLLYTFHSLVCPLTYSFFLNPSITIPLIAPSNSPSIFLNSLSIPSILSSHSHFIFAPRPNALV